MYIRSIVLALCVIGALSQELAEETTVAPTPTPPPAANTTTPTSTTTTTPTTPAPPPKDSFFRVTENNVTCIMFSGDVKLSITFPTTEGKTNTTVVSVPSPSSKDNVSAQGSCGADQYITISWGDDNTRSSFKMLFNSTGKTWNIQSTEASIYLDDTTFLNVSDSGKFLSVNGVYPGITNKSVDTNSSLTCWSAVESTNFTAMVLGSSSNYTVTSTAIGMQIQAFNFKPNDESLQQGYSCSADATSDLVPIVVGCALAGLVVLVLISYLVGRRRRSAAYESV